MERLLTPRELSELIALAQQTIYNRRAAGGNLPPSILLGRGVRFKASDVTRWMEQHRENRDVQAAAAASEGGQK